MAGDFRLGLANGAAMITGVAMITRVTAMITGRVAMMDVAAADSRWRSFPLRGPLPFSGANAALGYLPLQLALRVEGRKLKICPGKGRFLQQVVFHDLCKQKSRIFHSKHDT